MAGLASALAAQGAKVTYIAGESVSVERAQQGWSMPKMPGVCLEIVADAARIPVRAVRFPNNTIHLTQGLLRNGYVSDVISELRSRRARWGAMMETVGDRGLLGQLKRLNYAMALGRAGTRPDFVLAIGMQMADWVAARGFPRERVFPFAYFLDDTLEAVPAMRQQGPVRIGFIGQFIQRKRLDLLIQALANLGDRKFELVVIGSGPLELKLRRMAETLLGQNRVRWIGRLPIATAQREIGALDYLVLPSDHDGWGAVVSEALLAGVPAICSNACGSAVAVHASGVGGVFPAGDEDALCSLLEWSVEAEQYNLDRRDAIAHWANCLSSESGARYLESVIASVYRAQARPRTPWDRVARVD